MLTQSNNFSTYYGTSIGYLLQIIFLILFSLILKTVFTCFTSTKVFVVGGGGGFRCFVNKFIVFI